MTEDEEETQDYLLREERIAGLREAAEIVADLDTKYIGAQGCFKEAQRTILARITELEKP